MTETTNQQNNTNEKELKILLFNQINTMEFSKLLFEQYKIYVDLADKVSQRRVTANSFFISVNVILITIASWFKNDFGSFLYLISVVGIIFSIFWFFTIRSYKQLNSGKFKVIHEIEAHLPLNLFKYEWEVLRSGKSFKSYWALSHVEQVIPIIFILLYLSLGLLRCFNL